MNEGNDGIVIRTMHVNVKVHKLDVCGIDVFQFIPMQEEFEDTKGVIRIRILKKNRQHNGQKIPKGNQNPYIEEEQTTQWPKDTKGR